MPTIRAFSAVQSALGFIILTPQPDTGSVGGDIGQFGLGLATGGLVSGAGSALGTGVSPFVFQYFPETMRDEQPVNYTTIDIPGGSHPLLQWINGGLRLISFRATFTSERIVPPPQVDITNKYNVDVNSAIKFLQSFRHPTYDAVSQLRARPPQRLALLASGTALSELPFMPLSVVMWSMSVEYRAWHSAGIPRHADVDLVFAECIQSPTGGIHYTDRNSYGFILAKTLYSAPLQIARRAFSA